MGCPVEWTRLPADSERDSRISYRGKDACGLEVLTRFHFTALRRRIEFTTEVCTGVARTKEQSQRRAFNLIPILVFNDRPTCKDRCAAELILARSTRLHQRPNTLPQTCLLARTNPCSHAADHTFTGLIRRRPLQNSGSGQIAPDLYRATAQVRFPRIQGSVTRKQRSMRVLKLYLRIFWIFLMTYSAFASHQRPCFQWVTTKITSVTAEVSDSDGSILARP